jgi:hypothetical protein
VSARAAVKQRGQPRLSSKPIGCPAAIISRSAARAIISRSAARLPLAVLVWICWLSSRQNMHQQPL